MWRLERDVSEIPSCELMTDDELCRLLRISRSSLTRYMRQGPPLLLKSKQNDIRGIRHIQVGGERRWVRASVIAYIHGCKKE